MSSRLLTKIVTECLVTSAAVFLVWVLISRTSLAKEARDSVSHMYSSNTAKQFVLLLGGSRTGSAYLGQFFNQNPDVLYMFEPFNVQHLLHLRQRALIQRADERTTLDELQIGWLRQVLEECETGDYVLHPHLEEHGRCGSPGENTRRWGTPECNETHTPFHRTQLCVFRNTVVLKITRLLQLQYLSWIADAVTANNVKIIHLIRDPREVIRSRFKFQHYYYKDRFPVTHVQNMANKVGLAAEEWCLRQLDDIVFAERDPPSWLKGNYKLITFPELTSDPVSIATELYAFLGHTSVPGPVLAWIKEHGEQKTDVQEQEVLHPDSKWNSNYTRLVEEECKPLIIKMGLQFQELDIQYTDSYY